jgi:hypothetical protein
VGVVELDAVGEGAAGVADADGEGVGVEELRSLGEGVALREVRWPGRLLGFLSRALSVFASAGVVVPVAAPPSAGAWVLALVLVLCGVVGSADGDDVATVPPSAGAVPVARRAPPATRPAAAASPSDRTTARGEMDPKCMTTAFPQSAASHPGEVASPLHYLLSTGVLSTGVLSTGVLSTGVLWTGCRERRSGSDPRYERARNEAPDEGIDPMTYMVMMFGESATMVETQTKQWILEMIDFMGKVNEDLRQAGEWVDGQGLVYGTQATTVRFENSAPVATDGPFAESKESMIGYWILDVENQARAVEFAKKIVAFTHGPIEVRQVMDGPPEV